MKNEKVILLIMPYGSVGGMERLALTFYDYYKSQGYIVKALKFIKLDSDIINFGEDEHYFSSKDLGEMSIFKRILFYIRSPFKLRKLIKKEGVTDSISFGDMANVFSSFTFTKEYKIGSIHSFKSVEFQEKNMFNVLFKWSYKGSYRFLNKVVCISQTVKTDLIENCGYAFDNLSVIYNPHNIEEIIRLSTIPIVDPHEQELFSKKTILFIGRLSVVKAPWHLLKAFHLLLEEEEELNLVFIGDGDQRVRAYLEEYLHFLGISNKVHFLGRRSNPYQYLAKANILALSSLYEGTPNVIVESLAVKTPVVTTKCTDGVLELMCIDQDFPKYDESELLHTEGGIITPNLFKGMLTIPNTIDKEYSLEERKLMEGLKYALNHNEQLREGIYTHYNKLLSKFDLQHIAISYLQH